jgi:pimeloyl-ACP methyl ester carboxylesterase
LPLIFSAPARDVGNWVLGSLRGLGLRHVRGEEIWQSFASLTDPANRQAFLCTMRAVIDPGGQSVSAMDRLYLAAHMPTLIVWGDKDKIIPPMHADKAHEAMPNSRLAVMEGVGHYPHAEDPVRFAEILVDFLETTEPSSFTPEELRQQLRRGS